MPTTNILQTFGTAIILANGATHAPGATAKNNLGADTADQIDLTSLAAGAYRQSDKFNFLDPHAFLWEVTAAFEPTSAPNGTSPVNMWLAFSHSGTAGQDNPANLTGADAAYVGYGAAAADADEAVNLLVPIGSRTLTADAAIQVAHYNKFRPGGQWGILVVQNNLNVGFISDAIEMSIRLRPIIDQFQA